MPETPSCRSVESPHPAVAALKHGSSAETAASSHEGRMVHHSPPLTRPQLPRAGDAAQMRSDPHPSEFHQPHGPDTAMDPAPTATGGQLYVEISNQQQDALPGTSAANCPADVPDELVPSFSRRLRPAADEVGSQALTPAMVPHAQAHIQAQHDTFTTPSVAVIKDTPQSAAAATPWSRVKDTPSTSEVTLLQRGYLPHGFSWLGLDQPSSSKAPLSAPVQSSSQAANSALQQQHVSDATAAIRGDGLYPGGRPQGQFDASPPAPELTLRLSLSDGSSTKSNKAGQPTPSRGAHPLPHQQATPPMQPRLTVAPTHPNVPPAAAKGAAWSEVPQHHSLHASQAGHTLQVGGQLQDQQPLGQQPVGQQPLGQQPLGQQLRLHHPAAATDSCCQSQAADGDSPSPTLAVPAAAIAPTPALAAAVAPPPADASHPVSPRVSSRFGAQGTMPQLPHEHDPDYGHVVDADAEHDISAIGEAEGSGRGGSDSAAAGCGVGDPYSADQQADQSCDDDPEGSPQPQNHDESQHDASGDGPALAGSDPDGDAPNDAPGDPDPGGDAPDDTDPAGDAPDDPDPAGDNPDPDDAAPDDPDPDGDPPDDPDPDSTAAAELVPHRFKRPAPTQVTHACCSCILHHQAAIPSRVNAHRPERRAVQPRSCFCCWCHNLQPL